jgi:hypothetical protein
LLLSTDGMEPTDGTDGMDGNGKVVSHEWGCNIILSIEAWDIGKMICGRSEGKALKASRKPNSQIQCVVRDSLIDHIVQCSSDHFSFIDFIFISHVYPRTLVSIQECLGIFEKILLFSKNPAFSIKPYRSDQHFNFPSWPHFS